MTANPTEGPWVCYADLPSTDPNWHIITTANRLRLVANVHIEPGNKTDEANARLLTAAPDLLAALHKIVNNWDDLHPKDRLQAKAAIAQVTDAP